MSNCDKNRVAMTTSWRAGEHSDEDVSVTCALIPAQLMVDSSHVTCVTVRPADGASCVQTEAEAESG